MDIPGQLPYLSMVDSDRSCNEIQIIQGTNIIPTLPRPLPLIWAC